jgi:hypothetical protein
MSIAQPTLADVWMLFKETDKKFQDTERFIKDLSVSQKDTDRKFQDTERLIKDLSVSHKETERLVMEVSRNVGDLNNRLGEFVEHKVRPAAVRLFRERGIDIHVVQYNVSANRNGEGVEIDLLVTNDKDIVAIECKSKMSIEYIDDHLERLEKIKRVIPLYQHHQIMGAVAAMVLPDDVARYAYRKGLFVIAQDGADLILRNDDKFRPTLW